jgi:hypothetical protein
MAASVDDAHRQTRRLLLDLQARLDDHESALSRGDGVTPEDDPPQDLVVAIRGARASLDALNAALGREPGQRKERYVCIVFDAFGWLFVFIFLYVIFKNLWFGIVPSLVARILTFFFFFFFRRILECSHTPASAAGARGCSNRSSPTLHSPSNSTPCCKRQPLCAAKSFSRAAAVASVAAQRRCTMHELTR